MRKLFKLLMLLSVFLFIGCAGLHYPSNQKIALILAGVNFDETQYAVLQAQLLNQQLKPISVSPDGSFAISDKGRAVSVDYSYENLDINNVSGIIIIGGVGIQDVTEDSRYTSLIQRAIESRILIGALEYAPATLVSSGILKGKNVNAWPSDRKLITAAGGHYQSGLTSSDENLITGIGGSDKNIKAFYGVFSSALFSKTNSDVQQIPFTLTEKGSLFVMDHAGFTRTGTIVRPNNENRPWSLIFGLHGLAGTAEEFRKQVGLDAYADELNFLLVYPDGYNGDWDVVSNDLTSYDEKGYFSQLIKELESRYPIDPNRIYITGISLGGFMSYRLAADMQGVFAAAAPVAGSWYPPSPKELDIQNIS